MRAKQQQNGRVGNGKHLLQNGVGKGSPKSQTFEFRIGMQVGIALGECHLQVQKLETTMVQLSEVSDDITDVIGYLKEQTGMFAFVLLFFAFGNVFLYQVFFFFMWFECLQWLTKKKKQNKMK